MKKMLVVYYSWSNGNTKRIAEQLTNGTGADIARIETTEPYSGSHEDVVEQGKREVEAGFMPQINPISVNLADYDVIAIGTPTWWYTMAPAVLTFLTTNDFNRKDSDSIYDKWWMAGAMVNKRYGGKLAKELPLHMKCRFSLITKEKIIW